MSALDDLLKKHRRKIIEREQKTFRALRAAYSEIEKELNKSYEKLQKEIEKAIENGEEISPAWFYREKRLKNLLAQVREQITRFGDQAATIVKSEQRAAVELAVNQSKETFDLQTSDFDSQNIGSTLNTRNVETAVGLMGDGSPIHEYFEQQLAPLVAEKIKSEVIKASAIGTDFKTLAKRLHETGNITKFRALSVARTEVNRVRRETTRQIYEENSDIIEGWEWVASKSTRTCPLCLAMDGKQFPVDEPFPQHINCRCTMIAVIIGLPRRQRTIGNDWFEKQSDADKEKILGKEAFLAYKDKNLSLDDFVTFRNDKRFGKSVARKPLAKILADKQTFPIRSLKELDAAARQIGISKTEFNNKTELADVVLTELAELNKRFPQYGVPKVLRIDSFEDVALFDHRNNIPKMLVNKDDVFWNNPERWADIYFDKGFWSSTNPNHPIRHEYAHFVHYLEKSPAMKKQKLLPDEMEIISQKVSKYAATDSSEFVAEVFAGLLDGRKFSKEIMALYNKYGGVLLK